MYRIAALAMLGLFLCLPVHATDVEKEKRWAEQIVDALIDGDAVWLDAGGHEFLAIETPDTDESAKRALIVVHGVGVHPDWDQVIKPIRVDMTEQGWHTLSIQMPVLANDAESYQYTPLFDEVPARFEAAIKYLQEQGMQQIVIAAHSMGAAMSAFYLAETPNSPVKAFVAVGLNAANKDPRVNAANSLAKIKIPVIEIYGSEDIPPVLETAQLRAEAAQKAGNDYDQIVVEGAGHFFDNHEETLLEHVHQWLIKQGYK